MTKERCTCLFFLKVGSAFEDAQGSIPDSCRHVSDPVVVLPRYDAAIALRQADMERTLSGPLALRRKWYKHEDSRPFSCMLWCTIALGAMTNSMCSRLVRVFATTAVGGRRQEVADTTRRAVRCGDSGSLRVA